MIHFGYIDRRVRVSRSEDYSLTDGLARILVFDYTNKKDIGKLVGYGPIKTIPYVNQSVQCTGGHVELYASADYFFHQYPKGILYFDREWRIKLQDKIVPIRFIAESYYKKIDAHK